MLILKMLFLHRKANIFVLSCCSVLISTHVLVHMQSLKDAAMIKISFISHRLINDYVFLPPTVFYLMRRSDSVMNNKKSCSFPGFKLLL